MKEIPTVEKIKNDSNRWRRLNWAIPFIIGITVFLVVGFISIGFYMGKHLYKVNVPLADATMEIRIDTLLSYLWFEEMLGGSEEKNMHDILKRLDKADWYVKAMIEGGESNHLKLQHLKEKDKNNIMDLKNLLKEHRTLYDARLKEINSSGPGSQIDQAQHTIIDELISQANLIETDIKRDMMNKYQLFKYIWMGTGLLFLASGYAYYRYDTFRNDVYFKILSLQQMMVQSEKMAALGTMISNISHKINNPNNFISFNIPILKEYIQDLMPIIEDHVNKNPDFAPSNMPYSEFREDLNKLLINIENGSRRISTIVSDLKKFPKRKNITKMNWVDINAVIERIITISSTNIKSVVDSFETNVDQNLSKIYTDSQIIELVVVNLLNNAIEATDKRNSWIRLDAFFSKRNQDTIIFEVSENGSGIEESIIDKIFDPFYSSKPSKENTGMGLYLCRALADQIGATIEVESDFGKGSKFRLILPNIDASGR